METAFTVVLTPAQLAAVIANGTLDGRSNWSTRAWGGAKVLFGRLEELAAGGLLLMPEPTLITKVGGAALGVHGADTIQSGARQAWTGRETSTVTSDGTTAVAELLGVDPATARRIGEDVDLAVPVALTLGLGALRVASVRSGRIVLAEHEATALRGAGGHTIARHVGQTDAQLAERLASTKLKAVSTFVSLKEAEQAISVVVRTSRRPIATWARIAKVGDTLPIDLVAGGQGVGRVLIRGAATPVVGRSVRVVLRKQAFKGKLYYVLTAFPTP